MSYWDTSALAKLYMPEVDSPDFEHKAATEPAIAAKLLGFSLFLVDNGGRRTCAPRERSAGLQPA